MRITSAVLHAIDIPFKLDFTHATASRDRSDSFIVEIRDDSGHSGYGEVVARDYVTGVLGGDNGESKVDGAAAAIGAFLKPLSNAETNTPDLVDALVGIDVPHPSLPLLCAVETAIFDLRCTVEGKDGYDLLGMTPVRETVQYGGIIPFVSAEQIEWFLSGYKRVGLPHLKIKVGSDIDYNRATLTRAREVFGDEFDIRVDVNFAWNMSTAAEHLAVMRECGVHAIEEPFGRDRDQMKLLCALPEAQGMTFIADESCLDAQDIEHMADDGTFGMVNLRLAKNGGVFRCLKLAEIATELGIEYHLASLVGETGILSAMGRFASSLLPNPRYVEGSFDSYLLKGNVTTQNIDFGPKGISPILRGNGMGFTVDSSNLASFTVQTLRIF